MDLRGRIVAAYQRGEGTYEELAHRFEVGRATVSRLLRRGRERGSLAPDPHGGGNPPRIPPQQYGELLAFVREMPSATRQELARAWEERFGVALSSAATAERSPVELEALLLLKRREKKQTEEVPDEVPTLAQAFRWIVDLGGYVGGKSARPPGPTVMARGLERARMAVKIIEELRTAGHLR